MRYVDSGHGSRTRGHVLALAAILTTSLLPGGCQNPGTDQSPESGTAESASTGPITVVAPPRGGERGQRTVFISGASAPVDEWSTFVPLEELATPIDGISTFPPGLRESRVRSVGESRHTRRTLQQVIRDRLPARSVIQRNDDADRPVADDALRLYARGLDAALAGRHFVAMTELRKAQQIDPESTHILRQIARSSAALQNLSNAMDAYGQLLERDDRDGEALLALGMRATDQREDDRAIELLGRFILEPDIARFDAGAEALACSLLGLSLRRQGYDRAAVDAMRQCLGSLDEGAESSLFQRQISGLMRRRARIMRDLGDACARLDHIELANRAWNRARQSESIQSDQLLPRLILAAAVMGNDEEAQQLLIDEINSAMQMTRINERPGERIAVTHTELVRWLRVEGHDTARIAADVRRRLTQHPDSIALLSVLGAAEPDAERAMVLLTNAIRRAPRSTRLVNDAIRRAAESERAVDEVRDAALEIIAIPGVHPEWLARCVVGNVPWTSSIVMALESTQPRSLATDHLHVRLLMALNSFGSAWSMTESSQWRDSGALRSCRAEIAALLNDPALLRPELDEWTDIEDDDLLLIFATAARAVGLHEDSMQIAERIAERSEHPAGALLELARNHMKIAEQSADPSKQRLHARDAAVYLERATELADHDPTVAIGVAYELAAELYRPDGLLPDRIAFDAAGTGIGQLPESDLIRLRVGALQALSRRRFEDALWLADRLYLSDHGSNEAIGIMMQAWQQLDAVSEAEEWIRREHDARPGDPLLLQNYSQFLAQQGQLDEAIRALEVATGRNSRNVAAGKMLESAYRRAGRNDDAAALMDDRLNAMPVSPSRNVELAVLRAQQSRTDDAMEALRAILDDVPVASAEHRATAVAIAGRLDDSRDDVNELVVELALAATHRTVETELQVYGLGLLAAARLDRYDSTVMALAMRAAQMTRSRADRINEDLRPWMAMAQALIEAGHPRMASESVKQRLLLSLDHPRADDQQTPSQLWRAVVASDAASGDGALRIEAFIDELVERGTMAQLGPGGEPVAEDEFWYDAALTSSLAGDDAAADRLYMRAIAVNPDHALACNNVGYQRLEAGLVDEETTRLIENAALLTPDSTSVLDTLAWLRYHQQRLDGPGGALELIDRAIQMAEEPSAEMFDHRGDILWRLGRRDDARQAWQAGLNLLSRQGFRESSIRNYQLLQTRSWGLLVVDPATVYHRTFGRREAALRQKLDASAGGGEPPVTPFGNGQ